MNSTCLRGALRTYMRSYLYLFKNLHMCAFLPFLIYTLRNCVSFFYATRSSRFAAFFQRFLIESHQICLLALFNILNLLTMRLLLLSTLLSKFMVWRLVWACSLSDSGILLQYLLYCSLFLKPLPKEYILTKSEVIILCRSKSFLSMDSVAFYLSLV
jgi:hypothetical protein